MHKRSTLKAIAAAAVVAFAGVAQAQQTIKIANIVELSGPGTTAGTVFKNGVELAVKEINENGGILGKKISYTTEDTQTNPGVAKGLTQKAVDNDVFAIFGPVYSGSIMVSMAESKRGEVPNFTGGEAAAITQQGNPYIFRTSFTQTTAMPKVAKYMANDLKAKSVAIIWVNNDFGKGGRDMVTKELTARGVKVAADISTEAGQADFAADVVKAKNANPDAIFIYLNEFTIGKLIFLCHILFIIFIKIWVKSISN
jgi:branched-chain amino acid transport system substrate-binding protein